MLKSDNRLKKRKEFAYLYNNGQAKHTAHLTLVYLPTKNRKLKIGFSVSKKLGKAYVRNLVKRRLRMIVADIVKMLPDNYNMVVIAKSGAQDILFAELKSEAWSVFKKTGLVKE